MKARLIINPISGTDSKDGLDRLVIDTLSPLGWEIETTYTRAHGDATRLAREAVEAGCEAVFAAGGDGTVNEAAAALCGTPASLGIIPCGSGNGLARHLSIPVDIREGLRVISQCPRRAIDYATVNGHKFFCTCGVGFDAAVSAAFAEKKRRGPLTYLQSTIKTYANYSPELYTITANGQRITERAFLVAVCNASQYGNNAYIAPSATIDDGLLDVTIVHAGNTPSTALVGFDMLTGNIEHNMLVQTFRAHTLSIERTAPGVAHLDGEPLQLESTLSITCHPGQLSVFAPDTDSHVKPFITPAAAMFADLKLAVSKIFQK